MNNNMGLVVELLLQAVPSPSQIKDINISQEELRFSWRGTRFRVGSDLNVDQVENGCLVTSDKAILMTQCLRLASVHHKKGE